MQMMLKFVKLSLRKTATLEKLVGERRRGGGKERVASCESRKNLSLLFAKWGGPNTGCPIQEMQFLCMPVLSLMILLDL